MTKEELAVAATFLVAEVRKEIGGSQQGEVYADYASMCLPLEDANSNNRADTGASITKQHQGETPFFANNQQAPFGEGPIITLFSDMKESIWWSFLTKDGSDL